MSGYGEAIEISNQITFHIYFPDPIVIFFHKHHKTQKFYGETNADIQMDTRACVVQATF